MLVDREVAEKLDKAEKEKAKKAQKEAHLKIPLLQFLLLHLLWLVKMKTILLEGLFQTLQTHTSTLLVNRGPNGINQWNHST